MLRSRAIAFQRPCREHWQLFRRARQLEVEQQERLALEAQRRHAAEMKALPTRVAQTWRDVEELLAEGRKIASVYDEATQTLEKLKQLSEFQDRRDGCQARLHQLAQTYRSRTSLIERWTKRGWI